MGRMKVSAALAEELKKGPKRSVWDHSGQIRRWEKDEVSVLMNKLLLKSVINRSNMALEVGVDRT